MNYRQARIDDDAAVAPNCTILGDVSIGARSTVLHGAAVRGDFGASVSIGSRTNIQENAVVHVDRNGNAQIGDGVTIGHGAIVHGCSIGDDSLVGMGSIVMNGAKVGSACLIGAGSLVTEGTTIPDGMLAYGSPARVVRSLTEEEICALRKDADSYVSVGRDLADQGLLIKGRDLPSDHPTIAKAR